MVAGPPVTVSDFVANGILGVLMMLPKIAVGWHEDEASSAITSKRDLPAFSVGTDGNRHRTGHLAWSANLVELINWQTLRHQYAFIGLVVLGRRELISRSFSGFPLADILIGHSRAMPAAFSRHCVPVHFSVLTAFG